MFLTSDIIFNTTQEAEQYEWKKNCIQSNSFRKEEIRVIAIVAPLTLVSKNDRFVNISLLTDGILLRSYLHKFSRNYIMIPSSSQKNDTMSSVNF